jgi:hypothetical protein
MTPQDIRAELFELADAFCRNDLTGPQQDRLQQLVTSGEELRRAYVQYLHMHICLRRAFESGAAVAPASGGREPPVDSGFGPAPSTGGRLPFTGPIGWARVGSLLAASVLLLIGAAWWLGGPTGPAAPAPVATLSGAVGCAWGNGQALPIGTALVPGRLELNAGLAEITFADGAVVLVEAPAVLDLASGSRGTLHGGRVVARVPPRAVGFVIDTPRARFVDLGTEFGVGVGHGGEVLAEVFTGEVVLKLDDAAGQQRLTAGQTVRIDAAAGSAAREVASVPQRFVRRMPPARERGNDWLTPYNRSRYEAVHIVPAPRKLTIDGDLADWDRSGAFFVACAEPFSRDYYVEGLMMYDERFLYVAAHVGDPAPMCSVIDPATDPSVGWKGGAVQVRLSTDRALGWPIDAANHLGDRGRGREPRDVNPRLAHVTMWHYRLRNEACLYVDHGMNFHGPVVNPPGFRGAFRKDADGRGYVLEYAIPWEALHAAADPPRGGDVLGACWNVHWSDEDGRVWRGYLIDVLNPAAKGFTYQRALTWGRAVYHPTGRLPRGTVVPRY